MKKVTIVLLIFLTYCAVPAKYFYEMQPHKETFEFDQGRKLITKHRNGVKAILNYETKEDNSYSFFLYMQNSSDKTILVDPAYIKVTYSAREDLDSAITLSILNPESELTYLEKQAANKKAKLQNSQTRSCCFAGVGMVSVVSSVAAGESSDEASDAIVESLEREEDEREELKYEIQELRDAKLFWQNEFLRKTTLKPGEETGGIIKIPFNILEYMKVIIPADNKVINFIYKQRKIKFETI